MDKIGQTYQKAQVYTDGQGLSNLKLKAVQRSPEAIKGVAKQFEALFLQMMLKSMRDTQLGDGLFDSDQGKMYRDLFDKQIALKMSSKGSFGMAQLIERQLTQMTSGKVTSASSINPLMLNGRSSSLTSDNNKLSSLQIPTRFRAQVKQQVDNILKANNLNSDGSRISPALNKTTDINNLKQAPTYATPLEFAKAIWTEVKVAAKKLGVSPVAMLAQTALETGWGKHVARNKDGSSSFNLFGIKAGSVWGGKQTTAETSEYSAGKKMKLMAGFRSYQNSAQSVADYSNLLQSNKRFSNVLKNGKSVAGFATAMQNSGYATDPQYAKKIMSIANGPTFRKIMQQLAK